MTQQPHHSPENPIASRPEGGELPDGEFSMEERSEQNGRIRLDLIGELDIAAADQLQARLQALGRSGEPVLLDLHRLQFIDSSGLGELVRAVSDARRDGRILELDAMLTPQVRQLIELLELTDLFWPTT
jgi:anti-anti-sigma factor